MTPDELSIRQSLEIINETIRGLCLRRDQLASMLPNTKPAPRLKTIMGMEIKPGGGKRRKKDGGAGK